MVQTVPKDYEYHASSQWEPPHKRYNSYQGWPDVSNVSRPRESSDTLVRLKIPNLTTLTVNTVLVVKYVKTLRRINSTELLWYILPEPSNRRASWPRWCSSWGRRRGERPLLAPAQRCPGPTSGRGCSSQEASKGEPPSQTRWENEAAGDGECRCQKADLSLCSAPPWRLHSDGAGGKLPPSRSRQGDDRRTHGGWVNTPPLVHTCSQSFQTY